MTTNLEKIQSDLALSVVTNSMAFAPHIATPAHGKKSEAFGIYKHGYVLRLTDFLANDYKALRTYIGEKNFSQMAKKYIEAYPSENPNARWYSKHLPDFLKSYVAFEFNPEKQELAALELALNDAFDSVDCNAITLQNLAEAEQSKFLKTPLHIHPSSRRLKFQNNTTSIWSALKCEAEPPKPHALDQMQEIVVWRQGTSSRFRLLGDEEAMALNAVADHATFSQICELIAFMDGAETASLRAASYLKGWVEAELLAVV